MATLIVIFILLCFVHYYIETVIIPVELKSISLKLQDLRAELEAKKTSMPRTVFEDLESSITGIVEIIDNHTFSDYLAGALSSIFIDKIDQSKVVLKHESKIADDILKKFHKLIWTATLTSAIGVIFYFTPLLLIISILNFLSAAIKKRFRILSMRARDLFFPAFLMNIHRRIPSDIALSVSHDH